MFETKDHGDVREIRLARPPANALNPDLIELLADAVEAAPHAARRALVLSGRPGMFSGGLDVPELLTLDEQGMEQTLRDFFRLMRNLATSPIPVIAAITGHAPAGGAVISIFCDVRIMAAGDYRIGMNEVQVGLSLPEVIHTALRHVVGERQAERLGVSGMLISAEEALRVGLVDELVPVDGVVDRALAIARDLIKLPPKAMASTRELCRRNLVEAFARQEDRTYERFVSDWFGTETQGAMRALVERLKKKGG